MANKSNGELLGFVSFLALILAGVAGAIALINKTGWMSISIPILDLIIYVCLVIVVIGCGWLYVKNLSGVWQIVFVVLAVLALCGLIPFL